MGNHRSLWSPLNTRVVAVTAWSRLPLSLRMSPVPGALGVLMSSGAKSVRLLVRHQGCYWQALGSGTGVLNDSALSSMINVTLTSLFRCHGQGRRDPGRDVSKGMLDGGQLRVQHKL